ncbi:MAG TPA: hypothetical protein VEK76_11515 [Candidatus Binatia bacterium]|nr:hypothetical protein [Candidatus Binatia bacterium]
MAAHAVDVLVLKLTLTPVLIGASALIGRRWGPSLGGWFVGIPFTSGPIALVLSLSNGWQFAAATALGILAGTGSQAAFCLAYSWAATRLGWSLCLLAGVVCFAVGTLVLDHVSLSAAAALLIAVIAVAAALVLLPRSSPGAGRQGLRGPPALLDVVTRMVLATGVVLLLTGLATLLGPTLTGLLSPFPLFGAVMMVFSQRLEGGRAGIAAARGLLWGLFGAALFFLLVATLLPHIGLIAFLPAVAVDVAAQGATFPLVRRRTRVAAGSQPARAGV